MKIIVNGNALYYRFDGPKDAPVVMMAHAMGTSHRIWDWQMAALTDRWRVLRYDWLGHGDSAAPPGPYSLDSFVADAVGLMDALAIPKVHWVGISTGGMIGQGMGITHGDRLQSLSLCNTTPQATPWYREWVAERQAVVRKDGMPPVWDMTKRLWFTDAFVDAESPAYCVIRDVFNATPIEGYLGGTSAVADLAYRDSLDQISTPTLVLAAGADPVTPLDHSETIRDRIPGAKLESLPDQRHFSNVEQPDAFNAILTPFLESQR
jgi:3-oxoadipate enol-lactonase